MARLYANNFRTTLNGAITNVATTITVTDATGLPAVGGSDTCLLTIDDGTNIEIVQVTAVSVNDLTVVRGQEGTSGTAFADGVEIELRATAASFYDLADLGSVNITSTGTITGGAIVADNITINGNDISSTDTNGNITFTPNGTGTCQFNSIIDLQTNDLQMASGSNILDANGNIMIRYLSSASASNYIGISASTARPLIDVRGSGSNTGMDIQPKGTGYITFLNGADSTKTLRIDTSGSTTGFHTYLATSSTAERTITLPDVTGTLMCNLVEDTTPQLGADLDCNANNIIMDSGSAILDDTLNEYLYFYKTASATTFFEMYNSTGTVTFRSAGSPGTVSMNIRPKGSGTINTTSGASANIYLALDANGGTASTSTTLAASQTANRTITLPDATGTLALQNFELNNQTGTTYTLVIGDAGQLVTMNNASANTLTVPPNSSVAFPTGTRIQIIQKGAGQTTLSPGSGVTLSTANPGLKLNAQYSVADIVKIDTDVWAVSGDTVA